MMTITSLKKLSITIALCAFTFTTHSASAATIIDWTGGNGSTLPGWYYFAGTPTMAQANAAGFSSSQLGGDTANIYQPPGFYALPTNGGVNTSRSWMPRMKIKNDYGNVSNASIDTTTFAPYSDTIPTFKVSTTGGTKAVSWWYSFPDNFGKLGYANASTNRMDFYIKFSDLPNPGLTTSDPDNSSVHIGTYNCWGGSCPVESSGFHDYHYLTTNPGAWLHVQLDQHPQWLRDTQRPVNDPTNAEYPGNHYFQTMNAFYIESPYASATNPTYWLGNVNLWQQTQAENEESITSLWVGYWPTTGKWEVGFNDGSFGEGNYNDSSKSKHEIRWSTSPITNASWSTAKTIVPEYNRYASTNSFRRPNPWKSVAWTRFTLPTGTETNNNHIYFAVKDTSATADGDGHNASSVSGGTNIKTIDYVLRAGNTSSAMVAPSNLRIISFTN